MYWAYELAIAKHCTHDGAYWCVETENFAKFDMTKGYWQLGLAPAVRMATAFITWMGIFVWNRVPMGLQPAASYFQYCMLMIVLAGLAYLRDLRRLY